MSCSHATTTTVAWLYGEAPDAHALHVAGCPDCAAVADDHAGVVGALGPALGALRDAAEAPAREPVPRRSRWAIAGFGLAVAAAAALAVSTRAIPPTVPSGATAAPTIAAIDTFDAALDDLDLDVATLEQELQ
ncbi:MAG: hypothetical protein ABMB14_37750 [Myxococcota bacterium]